MSKKYTPPNKKNKGKTSSQAYLIQGTLDVTRSGMGYVIPKNTTDKTHDVLVRPSDFNRALNGDSVRVKVTKESPVSGKREGKIVEVTERKQTTFIGTLQLSDRFAFFVPEGDKPLPDFYIPKDKINGATNGDKVVVGFTSWESGDKKPSGEVLSLLTAENENDMAMKSLLSENGFPLEFDKEVIKESKALSQSIGKTEIAKRKDFRDTLTFTIDPVDAKDFDDAISIKRLNDGWLEIGVHIADVSHYVQPETALDKEAYKRATSVYLPDRVNPMLPESISNVLCSLRPNEEKLTFSAVFTMNEKGKIKDTWLGKTVIHSDHRFTYEDVQDIIEDKSEGPYKEEIFLLNELAQHLRKKRFEKGAINFSSQEVRFKLDEKGKPIGIVVKESKESHQLIEELMLLANKGVAEYVSEIKINKKPVPFPYRVHDQPDEEKLAPFIQFAKKFGYKFNTSSPEKIAESFNLMLEKVQGKPEQHVLEQLGIRTMAKAVYTPENIGHYGLGFENYCHFTSPIRRYPDILVHRILESCLETHPVTDKQMPEKCKHCSERERAAMDCERAANKYKQVEYMRQFLGDDFEGIITGVALFGFWVETIEQKCEGLVSIQSLSDYDEFRLVESDYSLVGMRSGQRFRMGDKVRVQVVAANMEKRQLDYQWVFEKKEKPVKKAAKNTKRVGQKKEKL